jgi:hypothetical protein
MSQAQFIETAKESLIFAVAKAEEYGVTPAQITLWLNAMKQTQGA